MIRFILATLAVSVSISCGRTEEVNHRTAPGAEIVKLQKDVLYLQGTVAQLNAFTANDFSNCESGLPPFETKICEIAQTATAAQRIVYSSQLQEISKVFQESLYGEDCLDKLEPGCPAAGAILTQLNALDPTDITQLQLEVTQLQGDLLSLQSRLDSFNGTGQSVETVILALENDIVLLEARVTTIEGEISNNTVFKAVSLCGNISESGPLYETVLVSGDRLSITAYIKAGNKAGLGEVKAYADGQGDLYLTTGLNSKTCKFKIYETTSNELQVCWDNQDRNATELNINTECDVAGNFVGKTANCTCAL